VLTDSQFGAQGLELRVDEGGSHDECDERNNVWAWSSFPCP
jgi:hypothetical protein